MAKQRLNIELPEGFDSGDVSQFKTFRKKIRNIYGDDTAVNNRYGQRQLPFRINDQLDRREELIAELRRSWSAPKEISKISRQLHNIDANYSKLVSYYANMFHVRYVVLPVQIRKDVAVADQIYMEEYNRILEVTEGMSLETIIPEILEEIMINGSAYLTTFKDNATKTLSLIILPHDYCRTVFKTTLGTNVIEFDFRYFELYQLEEDKEQALALFPPEFREKWEAHWVRRETMGTGKDQGWLELDPRFSTSITTNEKEIPPLIWAMEGIFEYDRVRDAETEKTVNQLQKILTHRIPMTNSGELIFDLDEVREIHRAISRITDEHEGLSTITTFGDTQLLKLQDEDKVQNRALDQAYEAIFRVGGVNSNIFMGKTDLSLKINLRNDKAYIWKYVTQLNNFINLVLNQLYNFKPFQAEVNILPITVAEEDDSIRLYRESATVGIGKLEAVIATGVKQRSLQDRAKLEQMINLDFMLKPLQSSHTMSGSTQTDQEPQDTAAQNVTINNTGEGVVEDNEEEAEDIEDQDENA
jgi:hypothetical protein